MTSVSDGITPWQAIEEAIEEFWLPEKTLPHLGPKRHERGVVFYTSIPGTVRKFRPLYCADDIASTHPDDRELCRLRSAAITHYREEGLASRLISRVDNAKETL